MLEEKELTSADAESAVLAGSLLSACWVLLENMSITLFLRLWKILTMNLFYVDLKSKL